MQVPRRFRLTLLACAAAAGAASAQVPAPAVPVPTAQPNQVSGPAQDSNWVVPPISVSGWVSYDLRATRAQDQTNSLSQLLTTHVSASSFIYQPWFATVNGSLGVTVGRSRGGLELSGADLGGSQGPFAQDSNASKDRFLTGSARVDLFPRSRFPFEAHFERNDSRTDAALASTLDFQTQNVGFSQHYRPASGAYSVSAGYDRRWQFSSGSRDIQDLFVADFGSNWKHNELALGLTQSQARRQSSDDRSEFRSVVGRHQYLPDGALSVNTTVNWSKTQEQDRLAGFNSDVSLVQWNTVGLYQPVGSKLALSSSVRGLLLRDDVADHKLDSLGVTLGATYEFNRNGRLTANGTATTNNSDGAHSQAFNGAVGASWQGDTIQFKGLRYDWFTSASAGGSTASGAVSNGSGLGNGSESQTTLNTQLGHTVSRAWPVSPQTSFTLNAGQNLTLTQNHTSLTEVGGAPSSSRLLLHTLAATFNTNGDNRTAYARASYNDSRDLAGDHARFQLLNLQVSGNFEFDRNRSLSGDMTWQRVVQRSGDNRQSLDSGGLLLPGEKTSGTSASGEIIYRQQRLFGFPRLRFTSRLKLAQDVLRQPGTLNSIPDRETRLWENRLDWTVGRLETQLVFRMAQVDGRRRDFLMWRVQRSFGD